MRYFGYLFSAYFLSPVSKFYHMLIDMIALKLFISIADKTKPTCIHQPCNYNNSSHGCWRAWCSSFRKPRWSVTCIIWWIFLIFLLWISYVITNKLISYNSFWPYQELKWLLQWIYIFLLMLNLHVLAFWDVWKRQMIKQWWYKIY